MPPRKKKILLAIACTPEWASLKEKANTMQSVHLRDLMGDSVVRYFGVGGGDHCEGRVENPICLPHIVHTFFSFPEGCVLNIICGGGAVVPDRHACLGFRNPLYFELPRMYYIDLGY